MKTDKINPEQKTLESEAFYLKTLQGGKGIPEYITFGHTKNYNILIETLLGPSLYNIFIKRKKPCHIIDVCKIGCQTLSRIEWIHSKNLLYRDIKPENFLIGKKDQDLIYIVDFGLCKRYISPKTGKHISEKITGKFNGTLIYSSPNVAKGIESSRRDDLISLGYMLIYLLKRSLPWESNFQNLNKEKYFQSIKLKEDIDFKKLFGDIPSELAEYINYSRKLKFKEKPNYDYLISLFTKIISKRQIDKIKYPSLVVPNRSASSNINKSKGREIINFNFINPKNIYLQKIIFNNSNNNLNLKTDVNSEKIFLNLNKNNIYKKRFNFEPFEKESLNHNEKRRKFKPMINNITNSIDNVKSGIINFKNVYSKKINYTIPAKDKEYYSKSNNNIHYKNPLLQCLKANKNIANDRDKNIKKKSNIFKKKELKSNKKLLLYKKIFPQKNNINFNKVKDDYVDEFTKKRNYTPEVQVINKSKMNNTYENFM